MMDALLQKLWPYVALALAPWVSLWMALQKVYHLCRRISIGQRCSQVDIEPVQTPIPTKTPLELCLEKLEANMYEEALMISQKYPEEVSADLVYKRQWMHASYPTSDLIDRLLKKVTDKQWALNECLNKLGQTAQVSRNLFEFGLELTGTEGIGLRLQLLHYLDRLDDLSSLSVVDCSFKYEQTMFETGRSLSILEMARLLIQSGQFAAFDVFVSRHSAILYLHMLPLLSEIPEVIDPLTYEYLLPATKNGIQNMSKCSNSERYVNDHAIKAYLDKNFLEETIERLTTQTTMYDSDPELNQFRYTLLKIKLRE